MYNDRLLYEPQYFKSLKQFINNAKAVESEKQKAEKDGNHSLSQSKTFGCSTIDDEFTADFLMFLCDMFKNSKGLISLSILKKKIASNLKNFKDLKMTSTFNH